ncbi:MAG: hypothetical protein VYE77_01630 [Planctomycetota bacterium]|nr:hypothetical protein [Planctomycetota bacterium]
MTDQHGSSDAIPHGAPLWLRIGGILEGRVQDEERLRTAVNELNACGAGSFQWDCVGGRFSLLPEETQVSGKGFDEAAQTRFHACVEDLLATTEEGTAESTLRLTLGYEQLVVEALFAVHADGLQVVSRARQATANDAPPPEPTQPLLRLRRREVLVLTPVLLIAGALALWQLGILDLLLSPPAEQLKVDPGPFDQLVTVRAERTWGNYLVEIRRGPDYPSDRSAVEALRAADASLARQAAIGGLTEETGGYLQLRNEKGKVLEAVRIQLLPLVDSQDGVAKVRIPGRRNAHALVLALTARPSGSK